MARYYKLLVMIIHTRIETIQGQEMKEKKT